MAVTRNYPPKVLAGVWRYVQITGEVYTRYNEHTKKLDGLSRYVGSGDFEKCGLDKLIQQVSEAEKRKGQCCL